MTAKPNIKLKAILFGYGLTQRDLAFSTGINESRISKIIRGYEIPTPEIKRVIAQCLKTKPEEIF